MVDSDEAQRARFETVFREHGRAVLSYTRYQGASREDAEDILVDTFIAAWKHMDDLPSSPLPWLLRVARRRLIDRRRSFRRYLALLGRLVDMWPDSPDVSPSGLGDAWPGEGAADQALAKVPTRDREALLLVYVYGLNSVEAASLMHCSPVALRHRVSRGRQTFRGIIEDSARDQVEVVK
jgi:RNA polymerase sigma factor (sigma-70 family)